MMTTKTGSSLESFLECPICTEHFKDPRVLPCIHSYCLSCIKTLYKDKRSGDNAQCPECRRTFVIPAEGIDSFPKNFFVTRLLDIPNLSIAKDEKPMCDLCEDNASLTHDKTATMYCSSCQQRLCSNCNFYHTKLKQTSSHKTISLQDELEEDQYRTSFSAPMCEKHTNKKVKLYCFDCSSVCCMMCFIELHNTHKCTDVEKVSDEFRTNMTGDIQSLTSFSGGCGDKIKDIENKRAIFEEQCNDLEAQLCKRAQLLHDLIDLQKQVLLREFGEIRQSRLKELANIADVTKTLQSMTDSLRGYMTQIQSKGIAWDVVREASSLRARTKYLCNEESKKLEESIESLGSVSLAFTESKWKPSEAENVIGLISLSKTRLSDDTEPMKQTTEQKPPSLLTAIQPVNCTGGVWSLAVHGDRLFVGREGGVVEVFSATTFSHQRNLSVAGLVCNVCGLAACDVNNCLYISDWNNSTVHKVDLSSFDVALKWDVGLYPFGLSVNAAHNVLVCCGGSNTVEEFNSDGSLVRQVDITDGRPWQAIEISTGQLVVSLDFLKRVCLIGLDGEVIKTYGNSRGSGSGQLNFPRGVAVDKHGYFVMADFGNNRIVVLNSSLTDAREFPVSVEGGLQQPISVSLDETNGRLYVGEYGGQHQVLVFDNVHNLADIFIGNDHRTRLMDKVLYLEK